MNLNNHSFRHKEVKVHVDHDDEKDIHHFHIWTQLVYHKESLKELIILY